MKILKITDTNDIVHKIDFPENLKEVSLNQKTAFDVCREDVAIWLQDSLEDETLMDNRTYYLYLISKAVSEFLDYPFHKVLQFDVAALVDSDGALLPNVLKQHIEDLKEFNSELDLDNADTTLITIYNNIIALVDSYKFSYKNKENFIFSYGGDEWEIPHIVKTLFTGKKVFSKVSVAQCVEILQIKKFLYDNTESNKRTLKDTETIQSLRFSSFLKILAFTVKKKGESLPLDDVEYQQLVEDRMIFFKEVDMQLAYDITFFLTSTIVS